MNAQSPARRQAIRTAFSKILVAGIFEKVKRKLQLRSCRQCGAMAPQSRVWNCPACNAAKRKWCGDSPVDTEAVRNDAP